MLVLAVFTQTNLLTIRRKLLLIVALGVFAFLAGSLVFRAWLLRDPAPVDIEKVVDDFANRTTIPASEIKQGLLAEGVYLYDTTGHESVTGKISTTNDYPAESPITVQWTQCGYTFKWQPTVARWDEINLCLDSSGFRETQTTEQHEFFKVRETRTYVCDDNTVLVPRLIQPGTSWNSQCVDAAAVSKRTSTVVARESVAVGSDKVEAVHVRIEEELTGDAVGSAQIDYWFRPADGLIVRYKKSISAVHGSPVGEVTYTEEVDLRLQSVKPRTN